MYKWVEEVNDYVQGLAGKNNNLETRVKVTNDVVDILNKHDVSAKVDCSGRVNTAEVVRYGEFHMMVETTEIVFIFKHVKKAKKVKV